MSFFTNFRADRLVTEIRSSSNPASPATQKAVAKLKSLGAGAIEPIFAALPDADKNATVGFVEALTALVRPASKRGQPIVWFVSESRNEHKFTNASLGGVGKILARCIGSSPQRFECWHQVSL